MLGKIRAVLVALMWASSLVVDAAVEPRSIQSCTKMGTIRKMTGVAAVLLSTSTSSKASSSSLTSSSSETRLAALNVNSVTQTTVYQAREATVASKSEPSLISSLVSGAASRASKEVILHPIDTVRARLQTTTSSLSSPSSTLEYHGGTGLYDGLYNGLVPALVSGVPAGAVFFAVKDATKSYLRKKRGLDKRTATILSVAAANVPYWLIRNPSEVLKTRQQVDGSDEQQKVSLLSFLKDSDKSELYRGSLSNIGYAYPADVVKFLVYESVVDEFYGGRKLLGAEAAVAGACAGVSAQVLTTPLDVTRTNIMSQNRTSSAATASLTDIYREGGPQALFRGVGPRAVRAIGSGAIQFASYELTQNLF